MRRLAAFVLMALLATTAGAQDRTAHFAIGYDVASSTMTYCALTGQRGDAWQDPVPVNIPIDTTGSSTTVDAVTPASAPFANLVVGDVIYVRRDNAVTDMVWITAKASDDQVTVNTAVDWSSGYTFSWMNLTCGTSVNDGWVTVSDRDTVSMTVQYEAGDLTGLDVVWECKDNSRVSAPVQVYPGPASDCGFGTLNTNVCTYATLGDRQTVVITYNTFSFCRLGLAWRTADGGTREEVHGILSAR